MADAELVAQHVPAATGRADPTHSVRTVAVEADWTDPGPVYRLPEVGGDYEGDVPPHDLQYRLYSLAAGEVRMNYELQPMPDGTVGFMANWRRIQDEVGRYLTQNEIVDVGLIEAGPFYVPAGERMDVETGAVSTEYSRYVATLTDIFNGRWDAGGQWAGGVMEDEPPTLESRAGLRTRFHSPFLWDLERERFRGPSGERDYIDLDLPRVGGEPGIEMQFGATDLTPQDDSFRTGYTYLDNPDARPDGSRLRADLYELSGTMFEHEGQRIDRMPEPLSGERGESHLPYMQPGDPRPAPEEAPSS
jgi:hypothetical protein